jgi:hypothetical protein
MVTSEWGTPDMPKTVGSRACSAASTTPAPLDLQRKHLQEIDLGQDHQLGSSCVRP